MQEIQDRITELESKLTGTFFDDLAIEESIKYWQRHLQYLKNEQEK